MILNLSNGMKYRPKILVIVGLGVILILPVLVFMDLTLYETLALLCWVFSLIRNAKEWFVYHNKNLIKQFDSVGERKRIVCWMKFNAQCREDKQFSLWFVSKSSLPFIFWICCVWNQLKFNKLIFARKMTSTFYISVAL